MVYEAWFKGADTLLTGSTKYFKDIESMIKFLAGVIESAVGEHMGHCYIESVDRGSITGTINFSTVDDGKVKYVAEYKAFDPMAGRYYIMADGEVIRIESDTSADSEPLKEGKEKVSTDGRRNKSTRRLSLEYLSFRSRLDYFASNLLVNIADQDHVNEAEVYYAYFDMTNNWRGMIHTNLYSDCPFTGDSDGVYFKDFQSLVNTMTKVISRTYMLNPDTIGFSMGSFPDQPYQIIRFYCTANPGTDWTAKVFQGALIKDKIYPMIDSKGRLLCYRAKGE